MPLRLNPLRVGDPDQPISFDVDIVGLDPGIFNDTLRNNTKLGRIDRRAHRALGDDSPRRPSSGDSLWQTDRTSATWSARRSRRWPRRSPSITRRRPIDRLSARVGNGVVQASGSIEFPNGFGASGASLDFTGSARGAARLAGLRQRNARRLARAAKARSQRAALRRRDAEQRDAGVRRLRQAAQGAEGASLPPLPLAFDLRATAGKNVRVRGSGYGAGLDIGVDRIGERWAARSPRRPSTAASPRPAAR